MNHPHSGYSLVTVGLEDKHEVNVEKLLHLLVEMLPGEILKRSSELVYSRLTIKPLAFDGQTSWTILKTQFDVLSSRNGWTDFVKASQLWASLRRSEAEILQGIPADKLTDLTIIEKALESRFVYGHLTQFYRAEFKTRRQKPGETSSINRRCGATNEPGLRRVPFGCSGKLDSSVLRRRSSRDENTQHSRGLMEAKDLKSALAYSMKYEAARTVSKTSRHVRSIEIEVDTKYPDKHSPLKRRVDGFKILGL
ncbi:hypothetical protein AVEN_120863-1 [Araneus ventricosus]|uniref:Uncharacterized protein n=1 Tax=Araneus ventricosus TaxID=182803 RepID=A0A4Y2K475_ARAVE|nr:hypothetical protein AVEN_120863-1 [Araneus ventricosus]